MSTMFSVQKSAFSDPLGNLQLVMAQILFVPDIFSRKSGRGTMAHGYAS